MNNYTDWTLDTLIWVVANKRSKASHHTPSHEALHEIEMSLHNNKEQKIEATREIVQHNLNLAQQCGCTEYCQAKIKEYEWFLEASAHLAENQSQNVDLEHGQPERADGKKLWFDIYQGLVWD